MRNLLKLAIGWSERLTLEILSLANVDKETLEKLKTAFNEKQESLDKVITDLKSTDPDKVGNLLGIEKILAWLKPLVIGLMILVALYLVSKIYHEIKAR